MDDSALIHDRNVTGSYTLQKTASSPQFSSINSPKSSEEIIYLVARGRFELPSEGPEPSMIDRYTTGLNLLLCYRKVLFSLINLSSLPFSGTKMDEKGVSIRINSLDIKYRKTNRNIYILSHILRVTTAGPDGRF